MTFIMRSDENREASIQVPTGISADSSEKSPKSPKKPGKETKKPTWSTQHKVRVVTAAALFDGHDAAINVMRRILQSQGAEVIHLGHNRGAEEVVDAAIQEDAQAIAVSSYQGGHMEYFKYMFDLLRKKGAPHITLWGGGGGVIVPREIAELHRYGINRVFSPEDGRQLGLEGMIRMILMGADFSTTPEDPKQELERIGDYDPLRLGQLISVLEREDEVAADFSRHVRSLPAKNVPIVGLTGTGGAGKSSLTDELVSRFALQHPARRIAVISVDPTRKRTGGALLGDRIRMNSLRFPNVYMRSMATRASGLELSRATADAISLCKLAEFDLIFVETSGIGQGDAQIEDVADLSIYVMTSEYGAQSQLEKIEMLDSADFVVINKFEHKGSKDALRDVRKQVRRNRQIDFDVADEQLPVFGTVASRFNDLGVNGLYSAIIDKINTLGSSNWQSQVPQSQRQIVSTTRDIIPGERIHYLAEVSRSVRRYKKLVTEQVELIREIEALSRVTDRAEQAGQFAEGGAGSTISIAQWTRDQQLQLQKRLDPVSIAALERFDILKNAYQADEYVVSIRGREVRYPTHVTTLSDTRVPRVSMPRDPERGAILRYMLLEGLPGYFPFTGGVFPFRRAGEDPKRMFAGEGGPHRTNQRFHYLSSGEKAKRLSTAFDSVTLYGWDPAERPDIYGKIGESGVSVCTLDDAKDLYAGFDLSDPSTSVSMTINGPAPIVLAFYMCTAIDQQVEKQEKQLGRVLNDKEFDELRDKTLMSVRGTVQADILKEDQGQNTCIFSTEFALRMMGDIQEYFIAKNVRNYYSVSISGYHIAEAGANPISQLAFTLANGFTFVEYYLSRGLDINAFAPNLSFFFSNGLDAEYTVIGRVARRIWAIAMRDIYGADERAQKFKYHIQTSGRSLHAMEIDFNDIRTTLQALFAYYDNCNSLHTNAYDEAITTPTTESVRRAMAIQMIIAKEQGLANNENMLQGSFIVDELTELVEESVLDEFLRIDERGGVLGAMERQYQRGKIQDESLKYERLKHSGELPIVGVNTFLNPDAKDAEIGDQLELSRASQSEKDQQIERLRQFHARHAEQAPEALAKLKQVAQSGGNIFEALMQVVRVCSLGQISSALFEVGGEYRRNI